jgi:hypothetical protein
LPFQGVVSQGIFTHPVGAGYNPNAPIGANVKNNNSSDILQQNKPKELEPKFSFVVVVVS